MIGINFAPRGWAFCDGQILPINQNQSLYSLLGTTYGGDGRTSFALPDLRGRTPIHVGQNVGINYPQGQKSGEENHTLTVSEMASHTHGVKAKDADGEENNPENHFLGKAQGFHYGTPASSSIMGAGTISNNGGGQAHDNMQPYTTLSFCIAILGLFPSRN